MGLSQRRTSLLRRLHERRLRERERLVLVEGLRAVEEALDAGAAARFAVCAPRLSESSAGQALLERLHDAGIGVDAVDASVFAAVSATESPQGVLLVCEQREEAVTDVVSADGPVLVLDALQDPGNVGTLVRSAVAFGIRGIVVLDGTADPWSAKVVRASAGAVFRSRIARAGADSTLEALREVGRAILVAAADGGSIAPVAEGGVALVVGNEGTGVRDEVRRRADATVGVRMPGPVESLNAGIAGSILMHELTKP